MFEISLHQGQLEIYQDSHKIRTTVCGRRFGKSRLGIAEVVLAALQFPRKVDPVSPERVLAVMPTYAMAKQVLWEPLYQLFTETDLRKAVRGKPNKSELRIDLLGGKPSILVTSAEGGADRIRGKRIAFILADEAQDFPRDSFDKVILPAMADTPGSQMLITGTPKGKTNVLYELYSRQDLDPSSYSSYSMPTYANPFVPKEEVERARLVLPPKIFRQEFEASFESFDGQIYSELDRSRNTTESLPGGYDLVVLGIDWGDVHPCVVALGLHDKTWYYLEGWQGNTGASIAQGVFDTHIVRMAAKYNIRAAYCDPSRPAAILAVRQLGVKHGLLGLTKAVAGYNKIMDGIFQVHSYIYQSRLKVPTVPYQGKDTGVIDGTLAYTYLESYHFRKDKDGAIIEDPEDGIESHCNDAIRYALANDRGILV